MRGYLEVLTVLAEPGNVLVDSAKDEHVFSSDLLADLDVGAVQGADDEGAVHGELHVGRP